MRHHERQIATIIIWIVYMILVATVLSMLLQISADFTGLWPSNSPFQTSQDAAAVVQAVEAARVNSATYLAQAQASLQAQLAVRVPLAVAISFILTLVATLSTYFVWRHAGLEAHLAQDMLNTEKAKRRSRVDQLVDDLDEEELVELRSRLTGDDEDEVIPLGDLLADQQREK